MPRKDKRSAAIVDLTDYSTTVWSGGLYEWLRRKRPKSKKDAPRKTASKPRRHYTKDLCMAPGCVNETPAAEMLCKECQRREDRGEPKSHIDDFFRHLTPSTTPLKDHTDTCKKCRWHAIASSRCRDGVVQGVSSTYCMNFEDEEIFSPIEGSILRRGILR